MYLYFPPKIRLRSCSCQMFWYFAISKKWVVSGELLTVTRLRWSLCGPCQCIYVWYFHIFTPYYVFAVSFILMKRISKNTFCVGSLYIACDQQWYKTPSGQVVCRVSMSWTMDLDNRRLVSLFRSLALMDIYLYRDQ